MFRLVAGAIATALAALTLAAAGAAASFTIVIKSSGFSPSTLTVNHGDRLTFENVDRTDHQVVADDGSFASPILHAGQSWTTTLSTAGTFKFHDALYPSHTGKVTVKGPPPSVTLALSEPIVDYGAQVMLSGSISTGAANESVELDAQPYGQPSATQLAIVKTGTGGTFAYPITPSLYTTYVARWNGVASGSVLVQVAPAMQLLVGANGYMRTNVSAPMSMYGKHVYLQRLSLLGQWVDVASLVLGPQSGRIFKPMKYLPLGISHIRLFLSVNQAGNGLLSAHTGTETIKRIR